MLRKQTEKELNHILWRLSCIYQRINAKSPKTSEGRKQKRLESDLIKSSYVNIYKKMEVLKNGTN